MKGISVLVVEDDILEAHKLVGNLKKLGFNVLSVADNVKDAIGLFHSTNPDIVLIDINLKGDKDGIDLGSHISSDQKNAKPIIYLTSMQDCHVFQRAKATHPHAFLNKPLDAQSLQHAIELGLQQFAESRYGFGKGDLSSGIMHRDYIFVKKGKKMVKLEINDINYIEVESKYCTILSNNEKYLVRISLIDLLEFLPVTDFQRISRNHVVNLRQVCELDFEDMRVLVGKTFLPISLKYKKELMTKFGCIQ
ncbi:MAG: LytR/AlgR family response regulator transcription factor [Bacteroidales bacterium]